MIRRSSLLERVFGHRKDGKDLIFRFVVNSVYPGTQFDDATIAEIYLSEFDVG
jgi:hypothetical protein